MPIHEEYLLYDLNAIVSAVGGSLGLFLGFSCYELVKTCLKKLASAMTKCNPENKSCNKTADMRDEEEEATRAFQEEGDDSAKAEREATTNV